MGNKGMKLKPRGAATCGGCGRLFAKDKARETYCSIGCAIWPRIKQGGPDECWPWQGGLVDGYGAGTFRCRRYRVSRVVLEEKIGRNLASGEQALHRCDFRACCNPEHLFLGNNLDNMRDKCAKGRHSFIPPKLRGEAHGRAKLTEGDVRRIWADRHLGSTLLGKRHGVSKSVIHKILTGENWGWLTAAL
jgi:hypothetical protein